MSLNLVFGSVVENLPVRSSSIGIDEGLSAVDALRFELTWEESWSVEFEERLKEVSAAIVQDGLNLIIAWIVIETLVVEISLVKFDRAAIVAEHELLEGHEAHVPGITLLIGHKPGELRGNVKLGTNFELPDASIDVWEA